MPLLKYILIILSIFCQPCIAQESTSCSTVVRYIEDNLPQWGVLQEGTFKFGAVGNAPKFVYLHVSDAYIRDLVKLIQADGFEELPYLENEDLVGAHITVIYPEEMKIYGIEHIHECGQTYCFKPIGCKVVPPTRWKEIDQFYLVSVIAPELDALRSAYGLPKRQYDFHITIGAKFKEQPAKAM